MFGTLADDIVILAMAAVAARLAVWLYKDVKRQQLQELQAAREAARAVEMREIKQRTYAEISCNRTMRELKEVPAAKKEPVRKVCGVLAGAEAQALWQ